MASTPSRILRGMVWSWRRRVPEFSTQNRHWQLSLRTTERSIARIIVRRPKDECGLHPVKRSRTVLAS